MIDTKFCKAIQQAENIDGIIEEANCQAIKFDDSDGFVKSLSSNVNECRVDYFETIENGLILIELKDIKGKISHLLRKKEKTKEEIQKSALSNIEKKFTDSLTIIRQIIDSSLIPVTNYLVVANNTESNLLDKYLPENLKKKPFVICETDEICEKLSTLNTRLCQE